MRVQLEHATVDLTENCRVDSCERITHWLVCCVEVIGSSSGGFIKHGSVQICFRAQAVMGFLVCAEEKKWHSTTFAGKQVLC